MFIVYFYFPDFIDSFFLKFTQNIKVINGINSNTKLRKNIFIKKSELKNKTYNGTFR